MFGSHGRYLRIDLNHNRVEGVPLPESVLRRFLGGVGLATYLLHREAPPGVDPLSPAAPLLFCLSPLVGTPLTTSAKFAVAARGWEEDGTVPRALVDALGLADLLRGEGP